MGVNDKIKLNKLRDELYELLETGNFKALSRFEELKSHLGNQTPELEEIEKHLQLLEMDRAKELLNRLKF